MIDFKANVEAVLENMEAAAVRAGRKDRARLLAVTKHHNREEVEALLREGILYIGENRVAEALAKDYASFPAEKHLIGHLQTNKAKKAAALFDVIESVDSVRLLSLLNEAAGALGKKLPVLLEVNFSGEEQKYGFGVAEVKALPETFDKYPDLIFAGLMAMAPKAEEETVRGVFRGMKSLFDGMKADLPPAYQKDFNTLSMGMSGDYTIAVEEGATQVRVGSRLFLEQ